MAKEELISYRQGTTGYIKKPTQSILEFLTHRGY